MKEGFVKIELVLALFLVIFGIFAEAFQNDDFMYGDNGMNMNMMDPQYNNNNNNNNSNINNNTNFNNNNSYKNSHSLDNNGINSISIDVNSIKPAPIPKPPIEPKCQSERYEHPVKSTTYSDLTGKWVIYTQIIETKNIANHCHRNEYIYLAHRQKSGWFWNPKITSLIQYSLGEPKFLTRRIRDPIRRNLAIYVNSSRNFSSSQTNIIDLDRAFPYRMATQIATIGTDDVKWNNLAKTSLPILHQDTAYFQLVLPRENLGSSHLKVLSNTRLNHEILE